MSRKALDVVRAWQDAIVAGDAPGSIAYFAQGVEWDDRELRPEGARHRGVPALVAEMRIWFGTWDDYRWEVEEITEGEEVILVVGRETGRGKGSGIELDQRVGMVCTVEDGRITRNQLFKDIDRAREAAGLPSRRS